MVPFTISGRSILLLNDLMIMARVTMSRVTSGFCLVSVTIVVKKAVRGVLTMGTNVLKKMTVVSVGVSGIRRTSRLMKMSAVLVTVMMIMFCAHLESEL